MIRDSFNNLYTKGSENAYKVTRKIAETINIHLHTTYSTYKLTLHLTNEKSWSHFNTTYKYLILLGKDLLPLLHQLFCKQKWSQKQTPWHSANENELELEIQHLKCMNKMKNYQRCIFWYFWKLDKWKKYYQILAPILRRVPLIPHYNRLKRVPALHYPFQPKNKIENYQRRRKQSQ